MVVPASDRRAVPPGRCAADDPGVVARTPSPSLLAPLGDGLRTSRTADTPDASSRRRAELDGEITRRRML